MKNNLFDNFPTISDKEWKLKVQAELKGLDYNETLVWGTREDINVKPLYTKNDIVYDQIQPLPRKAKDWKIISRFTENPNQDDSFLYGYILDSNQVLEHNFANYIDLFIKVNPTLEDTIETVQKVAKLPNLKYLDFDPFGYYAQNGMWPNETKIKTVEQIKSILGFDGFDKSIAIQADVYQNAGATHIQQIAVAIAHAVEYIETFGTEITPKIYFKFAVGSNFFFEISKIRAFRFLWKLIADKYSVDENVFVFVENSERNKSKLDIYNNVIRSSIEANSAILGSADAIYIHSYDSLNQSTDFGEEIAAKQQLLLKRESFMDQYTDPVAGSFYIESITNQMAEKALEIFKTIQNYGGFLKCLENETIQDLIYNSDKKEKADFESNELNLIGVNKFRNPNDVIDNQYKKRIKKDALFVPIVPTRLAEKIENN